MRSEEFLKNGSFSVGTTGSDAGGSGFTSRGTDSAGKLKTEMNNSSRNEKRFILSALFQPPFSKGIYMKVKMKMGGVLFVRKLLGFV